MHKEELYVMDIVTRAYGTGEKRLCVLAKMLTQKKLKDWYFWFQVAEQTTAEYMVENYRTR